MELGNQIREHRKAMHLSQDDLAEKILVARQTVSNWENGKNYPDIQSLLLLSELFQITLDQLVKGDIEVTKEESCPEKPHPMPEQQSAFDSSGHIYRICDPACECARNCDGSGVHCTCGGYVILRYPCQKVQKEE